MSEQMSEQASKPQAPAPDASVEEWSAYLDAHGEYERNLDGGRPQAEGERFAREYPDPKNGLGLEPATMGFIIMTTGIAFKGALHAAEAGFTGDALEAFQSGLRHGLYERIRAQGRFDPYITIGF